MQEPFDHGWRDAWAERNRKSRPPASWFSTNGKNPYRLDHAILSPRAPRASDVDYPATIAGREVLGPGNLSDHLPVVVDLKTAPGRLFIECCIIEAEHKHSRVIPVSR